MTRVSLILADSTSMVCEIVKISEIRVYNCAQPAKQMTENEKITNFARFIAQITTQWIINS